MLAHIFHACDKHFNFCCFRALTYTTLDGVRAVFFLIILKKGNRNKADNYRPVSLTDIIGKTFEAIIRDALVRHLEDNLTI